jgi:Zn-dependent alcohol dehydrogenase
MGHELIGVVEEVGSEVAIVRRGDFVIAAGGPSRGQVSWPKAGGAYRQN